GVDDLDDQREIGGELQDPRGVEDRVRPEPRDAAEHGRPGQVLRPEQLEQRGHERAPLPAVALADEDPHQDLVAVELSHGHPRRLSTRRPTAIPRKHRLSAIVVVTMMLIHAWCQALLSMSRTVS